jgi:C-terminal peptidase prc
MKYLFLLFALMLFACSEGISTTRPNYSDYDMELSYNYTLLKAFFYHPERIKEYSEYKGLEIDSMYSTLNDYLKGDRYTRYYEPEKAGSQLNSTQSTPKYYSFGFERQLIRDTLVVSAVYPISPADSAGLRKRDKLLLADGLPLTGEIAAKYRVSDSLFNTTTVFTVLRQEEIVNLSPMKKEEVQDPTVYLDSLNEVPYISVTVFKPTTNSPGGTYMEFQNALEEIQGAKTAIIDLRGNPGGSISHCTGMAAELAEPDKELVYDIEHFYDERTGYTVGEFHHYARDFRERKGYGVEIKWIILVNGRSASCSERFTAAVKASRPETVVIGSTTYGKGIGQRYMETYLKGLAFITSIQTFFPDGTPFHEIGIPPDVEIDPYGQEIYYAALDAAQNFDSGVLAKRLPIVLNKLPPERPAIEIEFGAYIEAPYIDFDLLHERE